MPVFDYKCKNCGKEYEYFHVNSSDKQQCPQCGSKEADKKPSAPSGVVKGASAKNNYGLKGG